MARKLPVHFLSVENYHDDNEIFQFHHFVLESVFSSSKTSSKWANSSPGQLTIDMSSAAPFCQELLLFSLFFAFFICPRRFLKKTLHGQVAVLMRAAQPELLATAFFKTLFSPFAWYYVDIQECRNRKLFLIVFRTRLSSKTIFSLFNCILYTAK